MTSPHRPTSLAEYRAVAQPPEVLARQNAEHWTGNLYMRGISPYLSLPLVRLGFSPNAVTGLMIVTGWLAACSLLLPGLGGACLALILAQLQMLWDCADGEVARWRGTSSPVGIFLDRVGHYTTESLLPLALGVRAAGGLDQIDDHPHWVALGALLAVVILLNKALNDMVHVARAFAGLPRLADTAEATTPRHGALATLRSVARFVPFHRLYHSIELTGIVFAAAIVDQLIGDLSGTRWTLTVLVPLALVAVAGHFVAIVSSSRLRPEAD